MRFALIPLILLATPVIGRSQLPIEPPHETGTSITGAYEGWFKNADGSYSLLLGYYNRNTAQELEIPVGPNNRIEPGGPDRGQPTHFLTGRQWGMFTIKVPADFGKKKLSWTIVANGKETVIPLALNPDYEVSPFEEAAGNAAPVLWFDETGTTARGPLGLSVAKTVKAGVPLALTVWVSDDEKPGSGSGAIPKRMAGHPVILTWTKYRGPGDVNFTNARPEVLRVDRKGAPFSYTGNGTTTALFKEPGQYILHVTANDYSGEGGGGFECCWTNGEVRVTVQP